MKFLLELQYKSTKVQAENSSLFLKKSKFSKNQTIYIEKNTEYILEN